MLAQRSLLFIASLVATAAGAPGGATASKSSSVSSSSASKLIAPGLDEVKNKADHLRAKAKNGKALSNEHAHSVADDVKALQENVRNLSDQVKALSQHVDDEDDDQHQSIDEDATDEVQETRRSRRRSRRAMKSCGASVCCMGKPCSSCFASHSSMACRALSTTDPYAAFDGCFGPKASPVSTIVPMMDLSAGDIVVSLDLKTGAPTLDRVVVNQHKAVTHRSPLVTIETDSGATLTVTPDHVIALNGRFVAASKAAPGASLSAASLSTSTLSAANITRVVELSGGVINPVTLSGTILVADISGRRGAASGVSAVPLVASTHPEWCASLFLDAPTFPFVATRLLSYAAPATMQAYYDAAEVAISRLVPKLQTSAASVHPVALALGVTAADAVFSVGFVAYALCATLAAWLAVPLGAGGVAWLVLAQRK